MSDNTHGVGAHCVAMETERSHLPAGGLRFRQAVALRRLAATLFAAAAMWAPSLAVAGGAADAHPLRHEGTARAVTVGLNKSVLIDLPGDVREVVISNPAVVEAVVRTARRVHLLGQQVGQATASFIAQDGRQLMTLDIAVERDLAPVAAIIRRLMPGADVRLEAMNDNIVVTGSVANPLDATRIADIAGRFVAKREQVLNMLNVEAKEQVLLRVSVVEMNRSIIRRLGIDVQEALASGNVAAVKIAETAFPVSGGMIAGAALDTVSGALSGPGSARCSPAAGATARRASTPWCKRWSGAASPARSPSRT